MLTIDPDDGLNEDIGIIDEETKQLMVDHDLDADEAEEVKDIMEEYDLDEDDAMELKDEL